MRIVIICRMSEFTPLLPTTPPPKREPNRVTSEDLLAGNREVLIEHRGQVYRLQHTRNDRLILVK